MKDTIIIFDWEGNNKNNDDVMQPELLKKHDKKEKEAKTNHVKIETIKQNLNDFMEALDGLVPKCESTETGFSMKEFDVKVGVSGKGEVGFLGTGIEVGAEASLTLKFRKM